MFPDTCLTFLVNRVCEGSRGSLEAAPTMTTTTTTTTRVLVALTWWKRNENARKLRKADINDVLRENAPLTDRLCKKRV